MDFVVDKVSEDSFYENLLLGLPNILEDFPNISGPNLERASPVPHNIICSWEQKNSVLLPEDLRAFYGSTDGILYSYKYHLKVKLDFPYQTRAFYGKHEQEHDHDVKDSCEIQEKSPLFMRNTNTLSEPKLQWKFEDSDRNTFEGKIEINSIEKLDQINGYEIDANPGVNMDRERYLLRLGAESKVFELENLKDLGRVVLVYINSRYFPNIWIQTMKSEFFFLSDNFTTYLRMSIYHMGIPFWQFSYTECGIPDSAKMLFRLMVPGINSLNAKIEDTRKQYEKPQPEDKLDIPLNKLDTSVFKNHLSISNANTATLNEQCDTSTHNNKKCRKPIQTIFKKNNIKK